MGRAVGQSDIDLVREATDLVRLIGEHIALRPRGREHVGVCPFHDDHAPSLAVVTHKGNAFYKCHACGAGGDAFDFVMNYHKMEFGEALRHLAERAGVKLQPRRAEAASESGPGRADLRKVNSFAASFYQRVLTDESQGAAGRAVIQQRGINDEMVQSFGLGVAPDQWDALANLVARRGLPEASFIAAGLLKNRTSGSGLYDSFRNRLIFPICDELGQPIAFGARKINPEDEPKYLNSAESAVFSKSRTLFGLHLAKRAIMDSRQVIVTEGYTDVIACHQAGITNVVGTLGTALTRDHARVLSRLCDTVVMLFDGDEAGQKAADRAVAVFFNEPVDVRICVLPDDLDPDELLKQEGGRERFLAAAANSVDALAYKFARFQNQLDPTAGISARQKKLEAFLAELGELGFAAMQGVRKRLVLTQLSDLLQLPIAELELAMPRPRRETAPTPEAASESSGEPISDSDAGYDDSRPVSRARRMAERELLAILIYEPQAGLTAAVSSSDLAAFNIADLSVDDFEDSAARAIAEVVLPAIQTGRTLTVQQVMGTVEREEHRRLASELYFEGQSRCGDSMEAAVEAIALAHQALLLCGVREQLKHAASSTAVATVTTPALNDLQDFLTRRRQVGHNPAAIAHGVRS